MNKHVTILSFIIVSIFVSFVLSSPAQSQSSPDIVGTWMGYDQTDWPVMLIFKKDMTLRVMLREFTWDTPYVIDNSKNPVSIDIDDFESEEITGVNQRDYRLPETRFLGIVSFSDNGNTMMLEGYDGKGRPEKFSEKAIRLTRKTNPE